MSNYEDIDQLVDSMFRKDRITYEDIDQLVDSMFRKDRITQVIDNWYEETQEWHNAKIRAGTNPESGLHGLPLIPWDERIDGAAMIQGVVGQVIEQVGGGMTHLSRAEMRYLQAKAEQRARLELEKRQQKSENRGCMTILVMLAVLTVCGLFAWMASYL